MNQTALYLTAVMGAGMLAISGVAPAAPALLPPQAQTINGTTYVNGGVGKEEKDAMRSMAAEYPLRITFSQRDNGELLADVPVAIVDAHGNRVFELPDAGPMLFVKLPPGKYEVSATFEGERQLRPVQLPGAHDGDVYFHWKGPPRTW